MKGDKKVIDTLNTALTLELTAINQYFVQYKMMADWGYTKLASKFKDESIDEMKHADELIERILFLEGIPAISRYDVIRIGKDPKTQLQNDLNLELNGQKVYNDAIHTCEKAKDNGSREICARNLEGTEEAVDWLETQLSLIDEIGLENYLAEQVSASKE